MHPWGQCAMRIKRPMVTSIVAVVTVGAIGVWYLGSGREPAYQGKPISYWLNMAQTSFPPVSTPRPPEQQPTPIFQAKLAVAEIGPEALPYVARRAGGKSLSLARAYSWIHNKLPSLISKRLPTPKPSKRGLGLILTSGYFLAVTERAGTNAIPTLVKLSTDKNPDVRRAVVLSLGRVSALDHAATLPVFERALSDPDRVVQFDAVRQLCQMSGTEPHVGPILTAYLDSAGTNLPNEMRFEALAAARAASFMTQAANTNAAAVRPAEGIWSGAFDALSKWQRSPTDENKQLAFAAFETAFSSQQDGPSLDRSLEHFQFSPEQEFSMLVPLLGRALSARSEPVRNGAAHMLQELGRAAQPAVPAIIDALNSAAPPSPSYLVNSLAAIGEKAAPAVPTLIGLLDNEGISGNAIFALSQIGPPSTAAVPALLKKAGASAADDHLECLGALVRIAPQTQELLPQIMDLLTASNPEDRSVGARMLGDMGIATSDILTALQKMMLEDEWLEPRLDAAEATYRLDPKQGPEMVTNVIELIGWTDAEDHVGPARMARLLGQIGETSAPVRAELTKLLGHKEEPVRIAASETLMKLALARKPECVAVLRNIMTTSTSGTMRFAAAKTLSRNSTEHTGEVVAQVASLLKTDLHFYQQPEAAFFLGEIGPTARAAIPQLRAVLESHDWKLRREAAHALAKIQKESPSVIKGSAPGDSRL
jgi:HEAT repeat protein